MHESQSNSTPCTDCNVPNRTIFCNDNLEVLRGINNECIDLIYLDPPFNTKKVFTAPLGTSAAGASFKDIFTQEDLKEEWAKTIKEDRPSVHELLTAVKSIAGHTSYNFCYLAYMAVRLIEMHRILKKTGIIYVHCDQTMSHYLKLLLDCIFKEQYFKNEIVWKRATSTQKGSQYGYKKWGVNTDSILMYTKNNAYYLAPYIAFSQEDQEQITEKFKHIDEKTNRKYYDDSAHIWRTPNMGARPRLCYEWRGFRNPHPSGWRLSKERMEEEYQKGNFVIKSDGSLQRRKYAEDYLGTPIGNLWTDINPPSGKENTNYPTQKPLALLERIIKASSNVGAVVLDPFCGCATTCVAAEKLDRRWIGIDVSYIAFQLVQTRIKDEVWNDPNLLERYAGVVPTMHFSTEPPERTDGKHAAQEKNMYM